MKITIDFKNVLQTFLKYTIAKNIINIKNTFLKSVNTHIKFKKSEKNIKKKNFKQTWFTNVLQMFLQCMTANVKFSF